MGSVYWAVRRTTDVSLRTAIAAIGVFLASPYAHNYDMTIVSGAVVLIVDYARHHDFLPGEGFVLGLAWFLPIGVVLLNAISIPISPLILGLVFGYVLWRIKTTEVL